MHILGLKYCYYMILNIVKKIDLRNSTESRKIQKKAPNCDRLLSTLRMSSQITMDPHPQRKGWIPSTHVYGVGLSWWLRQ